MMNREDDARTPATEMGRAMRERIKALKPERQPVEATDEQRERWQEIGKEKFQDPEYQRWAQSHRSRESLQEAGRLGYAETARRYGPDFANEFAASYRREHPSEPEKRMMELLGELGFLEGRDYEREARVGGRRVDFAFHDRQLAIEVYGGVHEQRFRERFNLEQRAGEEDKRHIEDVQGAGYRLMIAWRRELDEESLAQKREEIRGMLGQADYGHQNPWE